MSCDIDSDSFHGTKKGMRRKTVSSRPAYVNTPSDLKRKKQRVLKEINHTIEGMSRVYSSADMQYARMKLNKVKILVNDI